METQDLINELYLMIEEAAHFRDQAETFEDYDFYVFLLQGYQNTLEEYKQYQKLEKFKEDLGLEISQSRLDLIRASISLKYVAVQDKQA